MQNMQENDYKTGVKNINMVLSGLSVHRSMLEEKPVICLRSLLYAITEGDIPLALEHAGALYESLLCCGARRISGNLFTDYILSSILEKPNIFSDLAARSYMDEAVSVAMRSDLQLLSRLRGLDSEMIDGFISGRIKELRQKVNSPNRDNISAMSSAAWSGGDISKLKIEEKRPQQSYSQYQLEAVPPVQEWTYGDFGLNDMYIADEAMEEVYLRLIENSDWRSQADDLWNFFASYGNGIFLKNRAFIYNDGDLRLLPDSVYTPLPTPWLYEEQHNAIIENFIAFMQGDRRANMLCYGPDGLGKTRQILSVLEELPEARLVAVGKTDAHMFEKLIERLAGQPLKFIVLFENISRDINLKILESCLCGLTAQPENVLICATSQESCMLSMLPLQIRFAYPDITQFSKFVAELLKDMDVIIDFQTVKNICVDHQVEVKGALTVSSAVRIASEINRSI